MYRTCQWLGLFQAGDFREIINSKVVSFPTHRTTDHTPSNATFTNRRLKVGIPFIIGVAGGLPGVCDIGVCCNFLGSTQRSLGLLLLDGKKPSSSDSISPLALEFQTPEFLEVGFWGPPKTYLSKHRKHLSFGMVPGRLGYINTLN